MPKWTKGKWTGKPLTAKQRKAQRWWRRATTEEAALCDALRIATLGLDRERLHLLLDRRLDALQELRRRAEELFPEVSESLVIAECEI